MSRVDDSSPAGDPVAKHPESPGRVLVIDDQPVNIALVTDLLTLHGFHVESAPDGMAGLQAIERNAPDIVLLDHVMPGLSGEDVCRRLRADPRFASLPVLLLTSHDPDEERVRGLEAGADDAKLTENLQALVDSKVAEVERLSKLKRFLAPPVARRVLEGQGPDPLVSHRRDIAIVFFDLRNFTAFSERKEPEDVLAVLNELHQIVGHATQRYGATIERFVGDGVMVFFNDPEPIAEPCTVAADFALAVRAECRAAIAQWQRNEFAIDLAGGLSYGYASLGAVGFADRIDYSAIGSVANVASRLCAEAKGGELLATARFAAHLPPRFTTEDAGTFVLKGLPHRRPDQHLRSTRHVQRGVTPWRA